MLIPRLKSGGQLAQAVNAIIDYLPRLAVQNTPEVQAVITPRGQFVTLKRTAAGANPIDADFPFRVFIKARKQTPEDLVNECWVRWGTINGQPALDFPQEKISGNLSGSQRVVLEVTGNFQTLTAAGVTNPTLSLEDSADPLAATENQDQITWKIVLAMLETEPGLPDDDGNPTADTTTVSQVTRGHLTIGNGVPFST